MMVGGVHGCVEQKKRVKGLLKTEKLFHTKDFETPFSYIKAGFTHPEEQGTLLSEPRGMILGNFFSRSAQKTTPLFDAPCVTNDLSKNYWGSYLLFEAKNNTLWIARDFVGQLPLFYTQANGAWFFASNIKTLCMLVGERPPFNLPFACAHLLRGFVTSQKTLFQGIYELPHGCGVRLSSQEKHAQPKNMWDPRPFLNQPLDHHKNLLPTLENVLQRRLAQAASYVLDFSGGLDSSGLLMLLATQSRLTKNSVALNMFHPWVHSSDERITAQKLAHALGVPFETYDHRLHPPCAPLQTLDGSRYPNTPTSALLHLEIERDIGQRHGHMDTVFISGHGGDHGFLCPPPLGSLADFFLDHGLQGLSSKMRQLSAMGRIPFFSLLSHNLLGWMRYKCHGKPRRVMAFDQAPWLTQDVYDHAAEISPHPFFDTSIPRDLKPGTFEQVSMIFDGLATLRGTRREGDLPSPHKMIFYPFFSQPMIEWCLGVPCYASFDQGYNRYLFRECLSQRFPNVPQENIWRKDKGETTGIFQRGLQENQEQMMDLCLNGWAVSHGLVCPRSLEKGLLEMIHGRPDYLWPLNNLISLEIFFDLWSET